MGIRDGGSRSTSLFDGWVEILLQSLMSVSRYSAGAWWLSGFPQNQRTPYPANSFPGCKAKDVRLSKYQRFSGVGSEGDMADIGELLGCGSGEEEQHGRHCDLPRINRDFVCSMDVPCIIIVSPDLSTYV